MSVRIFAPWKIVDDNGVRCLIRDPEDRMVASVLCGDTLADARLIAAAPELLEAAQLLIGSLEGQDIQPEDAIRAARSAIRKATGEQA